MSSNNMFSWGNKKNVYLDTVKFQKFRTFQFILFPLNTALHAVISKNTCRMANREDPDQTAPEGAV